MKKCHVTQELTNGKVRQWLVNAPTERVAIVLVAMVRTDFEGVPSDYEAVELPDAEVVELDTEMD